MNDPKAAAAYHGIDCDGGCCPRPRGTGPRTPYPVCYHHGVCAYHLDANDDAALAAAMRASRDDFDVKFTRGGAW